jgi:hypothetical protein
MEPGMWLIEMATGMRYVCHVTTVQDDVIYFDECAWIATTGVRVSKMIEDGIAKETEVEAMTPGGHNRGAMISFWRWPHEMPKTQ